MFISYSHSDCAFVDELGQRLSADKIAYWRDEKEYYNYRKVFMLEKFKFDGLLKAIETAHMLIDFDARTGHNHGTKLRLRQNYLPALYEKVTVIVDSVEIPDEIKVAA